MRIGIAADHGGFELKETLAKHLRDAGHEITDFGAYEYDAVDDYPDFVVPLARAVGAGDVEKGIAVCGSGVGACIAANKIRGARACLIAEVFSARQGVEDDDMNIACLGGRVIGVGLARELVDTFVAARYIGGGRFQRRLDKVLTLEAE
jgi:ribose 5-phosphate isomerase B